MVLAAAQMCVILITAAHPNDEVLGWRGIIAKLAAADSEVHIAFVADGVGAREVVYKGKRSESAPELQRRRTATKTAAQILGPASVNYGDMPDHQLAMRLG
jgi:LmbE family N-acetylglucosaminyl deacetylase